MRYGSAQAFRRAPPNLTALFDSAGPLVSCYDLGAFDVAGTPFFPALDDRIRLKLLETRTFGSDVVYLRYEVVSPAG